ncbi:hypothetical protein O181_074685 [Austropuccinia psidii MF-1]|uniref:Uncharacterized protein n=1 Tax=Austropuccinia psidii MF-1 TaxID=1389203 RepID=A0A9Q3ID88_9BASI|nr:hypothetical protein [Austropuccinia psidii MF-1]
MIRIQKPNKPWEILHMDWVTGLPQGGDRRSNACLVIVDRSSKSPIFLLFQKDDKAMDAALLISNRNDPNLGGHDKKILCVWPWCTLLPALKLEYKTSIHASTNQTPAILEKGGNPKLPQDSLRKDLVEIHPTDASFKGMLAKTRKHAVRCIS